MSIENEKRMFLRAHIPGGSVLDYAVGGYPCFIGRAVDNGFVIPHGSVSGHHGCLEEREDGVYIVDTGSTNGLLFEGQKWPELKIATPQRIVLGRVYLDFGSSEQELNEFPPVVFMEQAAVVPPTLGGESVAFSRGGGDKKRLICPHCWHQFDVDQVLFIARHQSLMGDAVLGSDAAQRFLPSRFTPEGNAIDAGGMSCPDMACPRCHLRIPQAASEMPPLFVSIVGATASGKSYYLTSLCWELRQTLPRDFAISFADTDAVNNQIINEFEETMFLSPEPDALVALRKTELQGELYNQVLLDNMLINLPRPFMFNVTAAEHHPRYTEVRNSMSRTLVLYDNAGEHYEPGMDSADNPTTQHILHADAVFFLFDPTKDVRFRKRLVGVEDPQLALNSRVQRQEIILTEMGNRIRKYAGRHGNQKMKQRLFFLVSKYDAWKQLLDQDLPEEPWQWVPEFNTCALNMQLLKQVSFALRQLLYDVCPEVVSTAEAFADEVIYLPNSALGHAPELNEDTGLLGIRPQDVAPFWAPVPVLCFFQQLGFVQALPSQMAEVHQSTSCDCTISGDLFFVRIPGRSKPLQVPTFFAGCQLRCPHTDIWFTLPTLG